MTKRVSVLCILLASVCWGLLGLFIRRLEAFGLNYIQTASVRIIAAAVILLLIAPFQKGSILKIRIRDIPLFLGTGVASILFFTICYSRTIQLTTISNAVILLYTAPIMVTVMSVLFLREAFTAKKGIALVCAFLGCVLVIGLGDARSIPTAAIFTGLASGFGYSLYSIIGAFALRKYPPMTVTTWSFIMAATGSLFICEPHKIAGLVFASETPLLFTGCILLTGLITAVVPYGLYTLGLKQVEASKASIMCSMEPVVATVTSVAVFHEPFSLKSACGAVLVLAAIVVLNMKTNKPNVKTE